MTGFIDIRTATTSKEEAQKIASALVSQRKVASAQVSGPIESVYWWESEMVTAEEWVVTAKTRSDLYQEVEQTIRLLHPYEEPGIVAYPIAKGSISYFQWISQETAMQETQVMIENAKTCSKEQLLLEFDKAYEKLTEAATNAVKRGANTQVGEWEPREVLAHIAGWAAQATAQLPQIIAGFPPIAYASDAQHSSLDDASNAAFMALIGNQTFEEVLDIAYQTHQHFVKMLRALDDTIFVPGNYVFERMKRVIDHHLQHAQELENIT